MVRAKRSRCGTKVRVHESRASLLCKVDTAVPRSESEGDCSLLFGVKAAYESFPPALQTEARLEERKPPPFFSAGFFCDAIEGVIALEEKSQLFACCLLKGSCGERVQACTGLVLGF